MDVSDSILNSIKSNLGIDKDDTTFDTDIIMHINSVFTILTQIGVGPTNGFEIVDKDDSWSDFIDENNTLFNSIKSYMYMKVKLVFDPPPNSFVIASYEQMIKEFEWRLNVTAETN